MKCLRLNSQEWCKIKPSQSLAVQSLDFYLPNLFDDQFKLYKSNFFYDLHFMGNFFKTQNCKKEVVVSSSAFLVFFWPKKKKRFVDITRGIFAVFFFFWQTTGAYNVRRFIIISNIIKILTIVKMFSAFKD